MMKRLLSIFLCLSMLLALLPLGVQAVSADLHICVTASATNVQVGDTVEFVVTAAGSGITATQFSLFIPEGMTYVAGSAAIPDGLKDALGWTALDWTEDTMMWTGYNDLPAAVEEDTVILTFSCTVDMAGTYMVELNELCAVDENFEEIVPVLTVDSVTAVFLCQHSYTNYVSNDDETCTADGTKTAVCENGCGETDTVVNVGSATGHNLVLTPTTVTCTQAGYVDYYYCDRCDQRYQDAAGSVLLNDDELLADALSHTDEDGDGLCDRCGGDASELTQAQIVDAAYALATGEALPYSATLIGEIISVDTPYDPYYQNITVTIAVFSREHMPIICYCLKGTGAEALAVGDLITVTGTVTNYNGTIGFTSGCVLESVVSGGAEAPVAPGDPAKIVDTAYALESGASLPYIATLTGTVTNIVTAYDETYQNLSVNIVIPGREDKPILCYRLKGEGAETLAVGDTATVSGVITNYQGTVEFEAGCTLRRVVEAASMSITVKASQTEVMAGDTVDYTVYATGKSITALQFVLSIPEGMTYVPGSAAVPSGLKDALSWAAADWTEDTMMWTGYHDLPTAFEEGTVILTFSCIADAPGTYQIALEELLSVDGNYEAFTSALMVAPVTAYKPAAYMDITVEASNTEVQVGDIVDCTVYADGYGITAMQFKLMIPQGMTYVAGSAAIPGELLNDLGWTSVDWTEDTMMWTGYNDLPASFEEGTVILTFSCTVDAVGSYQVEMSDLLPVDEDFEAVEAGLLVTQVNASCKHSYASGVCTHCGAAAPASVIPTLTLKSPTLEFKDMITVNAMFTAENIDDVVEMGMITYTEKVTQWSVETAVYVIPGTTYDVNTGRYIAHSQGIHAKYLGDTVYLAVYAELADGTYAYSKLAPYSPVQYATNQLKNSTDTKLKQLVVAMLNYGAAAQTHFGHNTSALANASLTAEQIALPEAYRSDMVSTVASPSAEKQGAFANNKGFAKRYPSISFEGAFCINYFFTPSYAPDSGITLYYWNAADYNVASVLTTANASGYFKLEGSGTGEYQGDITGISAKALSEAVYVACAYKSNGAVWTSGVLGYSIGAYCSSQSTKGGTIADLAMATAVYGYHAKAYFD